MSKKGAQPFPILGGRFGYFYFFCSGEGNGEPEAPGGGGGGRKFQEGGSPGRGAGRVFAGNLGGGGA